MPVALREDLLIPIAGPNPSGESLRYAPVYDKIKEARREDDDAPQGEWQRERKSADPTLVIKLASDSLAEKSKDLQLAVWLTESLLRKDGFNGLLRGLQLTLGLVRDFWETVYPEIEDGDLEMRAAPLDWLGNYLETQVKKAPFTKSGLGYFKYKESRSVGYEEQANENETKRQARQDAIADKKITGEEFDTAVQNSPTALYEAWMQDLDGSLETIEGLNELCQEKFGDDGPSYSKLRSGLEEVRNVVKILLGKRLEQEGRTLDPVDEAPQEEAPGEEQTSYQAASPAAARPPAKAKVSGIDPADVPEAALRLAAIAKFLRQNDGYDPSPYLMLRGFRWGEVRKQGSTPGAGFLVAPPTEVRQNIKRLFSEGHWAELLEAAETAMSEPCGRAWLDLQRYVVKACDDWGYPGIASAIRSELKALLSDIPEISTWTFDDDTPVANGETQLWLKDLNGAAAAPESYQATASRNPESAEEGPGDTYQMAMQKVRAGRVDEAIEMLAQDFGLQNSGRGRFQRKVEFAQLCLATNRETLALPILEELLEIIDQHRLDVWEAPDTVAHALTLLYRCLDKTKAEAAVKQKIYARICRLDPMQALSFAR